MSRGKSRPVVEVDKITREVLARYESAAEASIAHGWEKPYAAAACRRRSIPRGLTYLRFEEDFDPAEDFTGKPNCPVALVHPKSGRARFFGSRNECAEAIGVSKSHIGHAGKTRALILGEFYVVDVGKGARNGEA